MAKEDTSRMSMAEAVEIVRTQPLMEADAAQVFLKTSRNMLYRALREGSIAGIRVGSKWRIPTAPYRAMLEPAAPRHEAA